MNIYQKLTEIQNSLKVPKEQENKFGGYKYRSAEDIQEKVKPLLQKYETTLYLSDEIELIGDRTYVKATATLTDGDGCIVSTAYAREPETVKGQSEAQITGASSSYARKYALNGLFQLDDTNDHDANDNEETPAPKQLAKRTEKPKATGKVSEAQVQELFDLAKIKGEDIGKLKGSVAKKYNKTNVADLTSEEIEQIMNWLRGL